MLTFGMKTPLKKRQTGSDLVMRKFILLLSVLLILTSCSLSKDSNKPEEVPDEDNEEESIIPNYKVSEDQYQIMLPYQPSEARGTITNQISNRFDIDEMEEGLRRHSVSAYDQDDYFFEEGQFLTKDFIYDMIEDVNPYQDKLKTKKDHEYNPRILSHIIKQNYLKKTKNDNFRLGDV